MCFTEIENEALQLSEKERARLAERLLSSLGGDVTGLNEQLWLEEAERRYEEYRRGAMPARVAEEVFRDAYRKLEG